MPAHSHHQTSDATQGRVSFTAPQVAALMAWVVVGPGLLAISVLADLAHAHILWPLMGWMTWLAAGVGGLGWVLYRRIMQAVDGQARDDADRAESLARDIATLREQVAAVSLAFESGREIGRAEGSVRMIGQRQISSPPKVG